MAERPRTSHQGRGRKPRQVGNEPQVVEPESDLADSELLPMQVFQSDQNPNAQEIEPLDFLVADTAGADNHFPPELNYSADSVGTISETQKEETAEVLDHFPNIEHGDSSDSEAAYTPEVSKPMPSSANPIIEEIDEKTMITKFAEKVKNWDKNNSKPIDMFQSSRPWTSGGNVIQHAIEMTQRPGSVPHRKNKVQPLNTPTAIQETSLIEKVQEVEEIEDIQDQKKAWDEAPVLPADGMTFENSVAEEHFPSSPASAWSKQSSRQGSVRSRGSRTSSVKSSPRNTQPQAYIPYDVAKRNMNRVIEDMKLMKSDHVQAISEVGRIYREIEDQTQKTFNEFVAELRDDYKEKVRAFTNIIEICLSESKRKEEHWRLQAGSMKECNIKLVGEVNELIEYNKKQKDQADQDNKREIRELRRAMTEERRSLLVQLQARESTLKEGYTDHIEGLQKSYKRKIEIIITQHQSNMRLREGVFTSQVASKEKQNEEELTALKEQHDRSVEFMTSEEQRKIEKLKAEEDVMLSKIRKEEQERLEQLQKEKEEEINRLSMEKERLEEEWKAERVLIKEEFESKISSLDKTIDSSEGQIKVHEDALAEFKAKVEQDMKEFEEKRKEEIEKIQSVGAEEKKQLEEELEATKRQTERKMRSSLANIKFHESQKQLLLGKVDQAEHALREVAVEQEEAEAGATFEKNQKLAIVRSEEEAKEAELEVIRSESKASVPELSAVTPDPAEITTLVEVPVAVKTSESVATEIVNAVFRAAVGEEADVSEIARAVIAPVAATAPVSASVAAAEETPAVVTKTVTVVDTKENEELQRLVSELRALCKKQEKEHGAQSRSLGSLQSNIASLQSEVASLSSQSQAHYMRSQELEKHLAAVLATSCEDEKQRKHNNKRLSSKQAELVALEEKKALLEKELEEWKEKVEEGTVPGDEPDSTFGSYVTSKQAELNELLEGVSSTQQSVTALTLLTDGEIGEDLLTDAAPSSVTVTQIPVPNVTDLVERQAEEGRSEEVDEEREERLKEVLREVEELKDEITELNEEIEKVTKAKDTVEERVTESTGQAEHLQMKIRSLEETITTLEQRNTALQRDKELEVANERALVQANLEANEGQLTVKNDIIVQLRNQVIDLEADKLAQLPPDAQETIQTYRDRVTLLEGEIESFDKLKVELELSAKIEKTNAVSLKEGLDTANRSLEEANAKVEVVKAEKKNEIEVLLSRCQAAEKEKGVEEKTESKADSKADKLKIKQLNNENKKLNTQVDKLKDELEAKENDLQDSKNALKKAEKAAKEALKEAKAGPGAGKKGPAAKAGGASDAQVKALKEKLDVLKKGAEVSETELVELKKKLRTAESEAKKAQDAVKNNKDTKKLELTKKALDDTKGKLARTEERVAELEKDQEKAQTELAELNKRVKQLSATAEEAEVLREQNETMTSELKKIRSENAELVENYNSERVLRKKYYNQIEDMKGKIRVYCRSRPLSRTEKERGNHSVILSPDEYTLQVSTKRGMKEFQFDQVYTPDTRGSQENVFEDVKMLVQSAVDGYNVCIFAYGQTGSGKTFTMIGESSGGMPGIAPRAFGEIYELLDANVKKFSYTVSVYMVELYNDQLLDLFDGKHSTKLDVKKDKKGMVVIQGAIIKQALNADEMMKRFEEGSKNRHVASTKMNSESSRSHLIIGIVMETTNLTTGSVLRGKLSLVDLAGSERASKTGATPEQLKEAQSINKSLSALGDVIQALSTEQNFVPYRNNKLTMVMQDSIGGNAKTLMFVNISPADYNTDETIVSLGYAARVKLITNDASKNADNKEIARLKGIISKLKKGESIDEDD